MRRNRFTSRLPLTVHARTRIQQRGISRQGVSAVLDHGNSYYGQDGAIVYHLDRRSIKRARQKGLRLEDYRNLVVVEGPDGSVLTAYWSWNRPRSWRAAR